VLRPFVEGYRVVADALERRPPEAVLDEGEFLRGCLALGQQHILQRRIMNAESVSQGLFASALRLARNRSLVDPGAPDLAERRRAFAEEVRRVIRRRRFRVALIGGFALPFHGVQRTTGDVDFLAEASGADALHEELVAEGARCLHRSPDAANYAPGTSRLSST